MFKSSHVVCAVVLVLLLVACDERRPASGFFVEVLQEVSNVGVFPVRVPRPSTQVTGSWRADLPPNPVGSTAPFSVITDLNGVADVPNGRIPAIWESGVIGQCGAQSGSVMLFNVTRENPKIGWLCISVSSTANPSFSFRNSPPQNLTITGDMLTSANGMPRLNVYGPSGLHVSQSFASEVSSDGATATFSFPSLSGGAPLPEGLYGFGLWNQDTPGSFRSAGAHIFSIGTTETYSSPFGVDASDFEEFSERCDYIPDMGMYCTNWTNTGVLPLVSLSTSNKVSFGGALIPVGSEPRAVKAYRVQTITQYQGDGVQYSETLTTTYPTRALVANFSGNSVTFVNLSTYAPITSIWTGLQPTALLIKPDETKAYVANYGGGTIAEINLTTMSLIRTASVGLHPAALDLDPSGSAIWVGGEGYLKKVDLNTLNVVSTVVVSGSVTSLAASNGQGMLVYNLVSNNQSNFSAQQMRLSDQSIVGTYAQTSTGGYQAAPGSGSGPVSLLAGATRVSANYGNSLAVSATPTGFVVMNLVNNHEVLRGTTSSPVRSISTSPAQGMVYLTAPASNALIMVPLPKAPPQP